MTSIILRPLANLRDLGGITTASGRVRRDLLFRADDPSFTTHDQARALVADGLRDVIDLRTPEECAITGRGPLAELPVTYHHIPLLPSLSGAVATARAGADADPLGYADLVVGAAPQLVEALQVIADSTGATLFHCSAGKDRTGVLAACLLLILGASEADIVSDYTRTEANLEQVRQRLAGPLSERLASALAARPHRSVLGAEADSMVTMLTTLRDRFGDPLAPLRDSGLTDEVGHALQARLVETDR